MLIQKLNLYYDDFGGRILMPVLLFHRKRYCKSIYGYSEMNKRDKKLKHFVAQCSRVTRSKFIALIPLPFILLSLPILMREIRRREPATLQCAEGEKFIFMAGGIEIYIIAYSIA